MEKYKVDSKLTPPCVTPTAYGDDAGHRAPGVLGACRLAFFIAHMVLVEYFRKEKDAYKERHTTRPLPKISTRV